MAGQFTCGNPRCINKDKGFHRTRAAAHACSTAVPSASLGVGRRAAALPSLGGPSTQTGSTLSQMVKQGWMEDRDVLSMSEFTSLEPNECEVLLDMLHTEKDSLGMDLPVRDLAHYIREAYTGHDSLHDWAEEDMSEFPQNVSHGETVDDYAHTALINEVWLLPFRDDSDRHHVMRKNA